VMPDPNYTRVANFEALKLEGLFLRLEPRMKDTLKVHRLS